MKAHDVVRQIVSRPRLLDLDATGEAFAPANIALCKYWGKRDIDLNLPMTDSLSITLDKLGATTTVTFVDADHDVVHLNGTAVPQTTQFYQRVVSFLDLFRPHQATSFNMTTQSNLPIAAGLASSSAGFAALTRALNQLFQWQLSEQHLSVLARLGSGSACRSLWAGFVWWHAGERDDGMDSFAEPLPAVWPDLCLGLVMVSDLPKSIGSREAMRHTVNSSCFYRAWPDKVAHDLPLLLHAINEQDFHLLGETAESNALAMHATMQTAWPPICYAQPETIATIQRIWQLRAEGLSLHFTQDAGPNVKLLFLRKDRADVQKQFPDMQVVMPFA